MDPVAWNTLLDCVYGPGRAASAPDAFEVALLATSDPDSEISTTTEVDEVEVANGYARPTLDNDDWLAADEQTKASSYAPAFGTPVQAWETFRFFALIDPATDAVWNVCPLDEAVTITGPGSPVAVQLVIAAGGVFDG